MFKYPVSSALLNEARLYALESINHTIDYKGWSDAYQKMTRITTGKFAQIWLSEFCKLNNIKHIKDDSSPYISDNQDIEICGYSIDCKVSTNQNLIGQVSPHCLKQTNIHSYAFFLTDEKMSFISPCGFIPREDFLNKSKEIKQGEFLPNSNIQQRFSSSFFISKEHLIDFDVAINSFARLSNEVSYA